jgi:hypothetical protein
MAASTCNIDWIDPITNDAKLDGVFGSAPHLLAV